MSTLCGTFLMCVLVQVQVPAESSNIPSALRPANVVSEWPFWGYDFFEDDEALQNQPMIAEKNRVGDEVFLNISNAGTTTLVYSSITGRNGVITYQEIEENGTWKPREWERCGTFLYKYKIYPGKTAEICVTFYGDSKRERLLGRFVEEGTKRADWVVLAVKPRGRVAGSGASSRRPGGCSSGVVVESP
ncbi:MAG: hypothetical protein JWP89_7124 [Schlesneria sp.]|nr:hypothetical protein [Schlesneria sp.]